MKTETILFSNFFLLFVYFQCVSKSKVRRFETFYSVVVLSLHTLISKLKVHFKRALSVDFYRIKSIHVFISTQYARYLYYDYDCYSLIFIPFGFILKDLIRSFQIKLERFSEHFPLICYTTPKRNYLSYLLRRILTREIHGKQQLL